MADKSLMQTARTEKGLETINQVFLSPSPYSFRGPTSVSDKGLLRRPLRTKGWTVPEQPKLSQGFSGSEPPTGKAGNLGGVL